MTTKFAQTKFKWIHVFYSIVWCSYLEKFIKDTSLNQRQTFPLLLLFFSYDGGDFLFSLPFSSLAFLFSPPPFLFLLFLSHANHSLPLFSIKILQTQSSKFKLQGKPQKFQVNITSFSLFLHYFFDSIISDLYVCKT